ncbi:MAG: oligosaccharide flippase family protein [Muribaculaceae bacterium]|nr:oligosaccharide flippase family protein [Muribaculaceae bacterium]
MNIFQLLKGDSRSVKAKKNIIASLAYKFIDALVYLLLVPATLGYLNPYEYGIWLTLNSILMWINSFDIGLGNGLRNRLASSIAQNNKTLSQSYVSTTFIMLIIIMGALIALGSVVAPFINWYDILSTTPDKVAGLKEIVYLSFAIFCLNFIFKFIGNVYQAMQMPSINNLMVASGHLLSLIIIYILTLTTKGSLFWVAVTYSASPLIIYLIAYPITFDKVYPFLKPNFKLFRLEYLKDLFQIGLQFFLIQLSTILLFAFSNILISHMFGPEEVTPYNIAYRYFSLIAMIMSLVISPMWSATTDAYTKGDIEWIKRALKKIHLILLGVIILIIVMILISNFVYRIWIGNEVKIPFLLSALMGLYQLIIITSLTYSNFLNGLGKLKLQTINTVTVALLYIPLCYFLGIRMGVVGIIIGMGILNLTGLVLNYIQFNKIITHKATGIWDK